mmetsp:Transcript_17651/g.44670  ORF Transcript_17651/g.44670 Transcript_17651/m.44670 type:complete len:304 (-) Transcript_17651:47-958(-)
MAASGPRQNGTNGFLDDPGVGRATGGAKPSDACLQALCGKGKHVVRDILCESGNKEQWSYVGEGRGSYDTVKHYEYVGDNRGAFEKEGVPQEGKTWRFSGWLASLLLFGAIGGAAFAAGRFYAKVTKADRFTCESQDVAARSMWSAEQADWCCESKGVCPSTMAPTTSHVGVQQAPGQTALTSETAPSTQPMPTPLQSTTPPLVAAGTPDPPPPTLLAKAAAEPQATGPPNDKCNYDGVLFAANLVKWDPPVWKYSQESNTCSALRAGSSSWEKLAFTTQAECLSTCAGSAEIASTGTSQAGP